MNTRAARELRVALRSGTYTFDRDTREGWLGFRAELERTHATAEWPQWTRDRVWDLAQADFEEFAPDEKAPLRTAVLYGRVVAYTRALVDRTSKGSLP